MRTLVLVVCGALLAAVPLALGQPAGRAPYKIDMEEPTSRTEVQNGVNVRLVTVKFTITRQGAEADDVGKDYKIFVYEMGRKVAEEDVPRAKASEDLSVVLAVDHSGSMADHGRMEQVRQASSVFFQKLPAKAEAGLILFDDEVKVMQQLTRDRRPLLEDILKAQPAGGTAYLDAAVEGVKMLAGVKRGGKAVVVVTDGVDLNSKADLEQTVRKAQAAKAKVFTIGIGEPGKQRMVTSVLVLDKSGSMLSPADDQDRVPKIEALKEAATRFMRFVRETNPPVARTTILEFSDVPAVPQPFTNDHVALKRIISGLSARGETALFDATYEAISALQAADPPGKRVVVALTDGVDNTSRRRVDEVIALAKQAKIPLYMLGFGRSGELDEKVMRQMAEQTEGKFYHAKNQKNLLQIFENLSNEIHDDGIDEAALRELANKTGGQYYAAKDVNQLQLILQQVTKSIRQKEYTITFRSLLQTDTGTERGVELKLVRLSDGYEAGGSKGFQVITGQKGRYVTHGLVIPEMNQFVYLGILGVIGVLLALPAGLRRLKRSDN